jgi:hypothetical protein
LSAARSFRSDIFGSASARLSKFRPPDIADFDH